MASCAICGHPLGVGRFCTNCGARVDQQQPTATKTPAQPPPPAEVPPTARYPLFVDDVVEAAPTAPSPHVPPDEHFSEPSVPAPSPPPSPRPRRAGRSRNSWLPWVIGGGALLLFAMVGALLLLTDDDDGGSGARDQARDSTATEPVEPTDTASDATPEAEPSETPPASTGPIDLARYAAATVPTTADPNEDVAGNLVRYEARNMLDGVPETCWRMPGSGAGEEIVFQFEAPVEITEVGLVNGYAKTSGDFDWYNGNRRVLEVEWAFDDGTTVSQRLEESRELQSQPIDAVTSSTVTLRLLDVSSPGTGRSSRDYTAISDVTLVGELA